MQALSNVTGNVALVTDTMALVVVAVGSAEAFVGGLKAFFSSPIGHERRDVWLRFGRWLVAGLTFQLAADIIETSVLRTALNFFLERDLEEVRGRQVDGRTAGGEPPR
jgi:uncharacterized membrane protein